MLPLLSSIKHTSPAIEEFQFMPRCPKCGTVVAYIVAPHDVPSCPLKAGKVTPASGAVSAKKSLEYAVMQCYARYPLLFGRSPWSRWAIFNQLFFVNGSGYEWQEGRLVDVCERQPAGAKVVWQGYEPSQYNFAAWASLVDANQHEKAKELSHRWEVEQQDKTTCFYTADQLEQDNKLPDYFYRLCEYSNILRVPDDVQPDWLQGCYDALAMLEYQPATSKTDFYSNLDYVDAIRNRLDAITNSRSKL